MIANSTYKAVRVLHLAGAWDAALDHLGDADPALRAQIASDRYFWTGKGLAAVDDALTTVEGDTERRYVAAQTAYTRVLFGRDPRPDDVAIADDGFHAAAADPHLRGWGEFWLGVFAEHMQEDPATGRARYDEAAKNCDGDQLLESYVVRHQGAQAIDAGDRDRGLDQLRRSLALRSTLGARPLVAAAQIALASELPEGSERDMLRETAFAVAADLAIAWLRP